jgi:hypothetical protein
MLANTEMKRSRQKSEGKYEYELARLLKGFKRHIIQVFGGYMNMGTNSDSLGWCH